MHCIAKNRQVSVKDLFRVCSHNRMILGGARGKLLSIDAGTNTLKILRRSLEENYELEGNVDVRNFEPLIGKYVDLELCDFLVVGVTQFIEEAV